MNSVKNSSKLKLLIDKRINVILQNNDKIEGTLIGFDQFLNLVLDNCISFFEENKKKYEKTILIRGSMVNSIEKIETS